MTANPIDSPALPANLDRKIRTTGGLILSSLLLLTVCTGRCFGDDPVSAPRPVADLIESLGHSREQVRAAAAAKLCRMGPAVVPALAQSLKRPDATLQREVAFTLGRMGSQGKAAVPALIELLDNESPDVRSFAAFALGKIGPDATAAIPALVRMSQSTEAKLRKSAVQALSQVRAERRQVVRANHERPSTADGEFIHTPAPLMLDGSEREIDANEDMQGVAHVAETAGGDGNGEFNPFFDDTSGLDQPADHPESQDDQLALQDHEPVSTADEDPKIEFIQLDDGSSTVGIAGPARQDRHVHDHVHDELILDRDQAHTGRQTEAASGTDGVPLRPATSQRPVQWGWRSAPVIRSFDPQLLKAVLAVVVAWFVFWPLCWTVLLWLRPLWLLTLNNSLARFVELRLPPFFASARISNSNLFEALSNPTRVAGSDGHHRAPAEVVSDGRDGPDMRKTGPSLRSRPRQLRLISVSKLLLVLKPFHDRQRVLDAWLDKHAAAALATFWKRDAAREHRTYVPLPVIVDETTVPTLAPEQLRSAFSTHAAYVLISGDSGTGKTCLACQFAGWALEKRLSRHVLLPVLIQGDFDRPLIEVIQEQLAALVGGPAFVPPELTKLLIKQRRILAIVDSISGEPDETQAIVRKLRDIVADAVVVATSSDEMKGLDPALRLQPVRLSGDYLSSFVAGYLAARDKRSLFSDVEYFDACRALSALGRNTTLSVLVARLFVEQMIFTKERYGTPNLPGNIPSLMLQHLHVVNQSRGDAAVDDRAVQHDMQRIARLCLSRRLRPAAVSRDAVLRELEGSNAAQRMGYLQDTLGLVEQLPGQEDRIRIGLNPLAEYLAGAHLVFTFNDNEHRWTTYLSRVERMPRKPQAIKSYLLAVLDCCLAFGPGVPDWVPAKLGRFAGLDSEQLNREMLSKRVRRAADALCAEDVQIRRSAASILRNCGPQADEAVPALIGALGDEDDDVRMRAVEALKNIGPDAVPPLCAALNNEQVDVRSLAAMSLGQIGRDAESAIPQLRESLADANYAVRANVAAALGLIGRVETVPDLIRALVDEHGSVRASSVQALGWIGQHAESAIHDLRQALKDEYGEVRRLTAETLGKLGPAAKVAVPELIETLLDADPVVSREAAESLLSIGSEAVPCLIDALRSTDRTIRRTAAYVLGSLGPDAQDAVRPLIVALRDQDATVRETAADALEQIHRPGPATASAASPMTDSRPA